MSKTRPPVDVPDNIVGLWERCRNQAHEHKHDGELDGLYFYLEGTFRDGEQIVSPIEQALYIGLDAICDAQYCKYLTDPLCQLVIEPQKQYGRYRVDFYFAMVQRQAMNKESRKDDVVERELVVECDSQKFHERTERERAYEKARDRYFAKLGIHVMHFTGAEILKQPMTTATEVLAFLVGSPMDSTLNTEWGGL